MSVRPDWCADCYDEGCDIPACNDCGEDYSDPCDHHRHNGHVRSLDPYSDDADCWCVCRKCGKAHLYAEARP